MVAADVEEEDGDAGATWLPETGAALDASSRFGSRFGAG